MHQEHVSENDKPVSYLPLSFLSYVPVLEGLQTISSYFNVEKVYCKILRLNQNDSLECQKYKITNLKHI